MYNSDQRRGTVRGVIRAFIEHQTEHAVCGEAHDGLHAIEQARELRSDLILMDLAMPELNGVEASCVLKQMMPKVPIILFTMYSEAIVASLAAAVGVEMVLSKPDGIGRLVECLQRLLAP
jgi:DNA-binding NarL/FixJ family response regulator